MNSVKLFLFLMVLVLCMFPSTSFVSRVIRRTGIRVPSIRLLPTCSKRACSWAWHSCSRSCGGGTQSTYVTRNQGSCGSCNRPSPRSCNNHCCPVNCRWGAWGNWESCSHSCDGGTSTRRRSYLNTASCGGRGCSGSSIETRVCNNICCPRDCVWGKWDHWGECSLTCGRGSQPRKRFIVTASACGGASCHGDTVESQYCNDICCPVDCVLSEWSDWGSCNVSCGTGSRSRRRIITQTDECGGTPCNESLIEHEACNTECCPVNCQLNDWENWASCSSTCGPSGTTMRHRSIEVPSVCGGLCSDDLSESRSCNKICLNGGKINGPSCSCPSGWKGTCCDEDVDECDLNPCGVNMDCHNTMGSFVCSCKLGFKLANITDDKAFFNLTSNTNFQEASFSGDFQERNLSGKIEPDELSGDYQNMKNLQNLSRIEIVHKNDPFCVDVDECQWNPCGVNMNCKNTIGSFVCSCKAGFSARKFPVQLSSGHLDDGESSRNSSWSESSGNSPKKELTEIFHEESSNSETSSCVDIDECKDPAKECHLNATCKNMIGSFECQCKDGFTGDGKHCSDVDECFAYEEVCEKSGMVCKNSVGSYSCSCLGKEEDDKCIGRLLNSSNNRESNSGSLQLFFLLFVVVGLAVLGLVITVFFKKFKHKIPKRRQILISEETTSSKPESIDEKSI